MMTEVYGIEIRQAKLMLMIQHHDTFMLSVNEYKYLITLY